MEKVTKDSLLYCLDKLKRKISMMNMGCFEEFVKGQTINIDIFPWTHLEDRKNEVKAALTESFSKCDEFALENFEEKEIKFAAYYENNKISLSIKIEDRIQDEN